MKLQMVQDCLHAVGCVDVVGDTLVVPLLFPLSGVGNHFAYAGTAFTDLFGPHCNFISVTSATRRQHHHPCGVQHHLAGTFLAATVFQTLSVAYPRHAFSSFAATRRS